MLARNVFRTLHFVLFLVTTVSGLLPHCALHTSALLRATSFNLRSSSVARMSSSVSESESKSDVLVVGAGL